MQAGTLTSGATSGLAHSHMCTLAQSWNLNCQLPSISSTTVTSVDIITCNAQRSTMNAFAKK